MGKDATPWTAWRWRHEDAGEFGRCGASGNAHSCEREGSGFFKGHRATFKVTSVAGHVFNRDFPSNYQDWRMDPAELFEAPTVRKLEK